MRATASVLSREMKTGCGCSCAWERLLTVFHSPAYTSPPFSGGRLPSSPSPKSSCSPPFPSPRSGVEHAATKPVACAAAQAHLRLESPGVPSPQPLRHCALWFGAAVCLFLATAAPAQDLLRPEAGPRLSVNDGLTLPEEPQGATSDDPIVMGAQFVQQWDVDEQSEAWLLRGRCKITQGSLVLTAQQMVVWRTPAQRCRVMRNRWLSTWKAAPGWSGPIAIRISIRCWYSSKRARQRRSSAVRR